MIQKVKANLVDLEAREIYPAEVTIENGKIHNIVKTKELYDTFILPGFIDAHVHIESSMLVPSEFAKVAVLHGTVATISDPHEIANVLGVEGVNYMIDNGSKVPFHFFFGAPSCVPATSFETAGATIDAEEIDNLLSRKEIIYLAEMMNYPGVIFGDVEVHKKLSAAKKHGKPIDGHSPGLMGEQMKSYFSNGITTDHECYLYEEGKQKAEFGVKILIREGSAAKNFETLIPLIKDFPKQIMFCSDDKHPDNLVDGHINQIVKRALDLGYDLFDVLSASSLNVINHYNLPVGLLKTGDSADFIEVENLQSLKILKTFIKGECVAENGKSNIQKVEAPIINQFNCSKKTKEDFAFFPNSKTLRVIEALEGQLITKEFLHELTAIDGNFESDLTNDILKIAVVNRYKDAKVAIGFIKNFGLKFGALASCVAHDCHNIVVVGTNDEDITNVVNEIIDGKGGIGIANKTEKIIMPLPIAGIMTNADAYETANAYTKIDRRSKELGVTLNAPFMTMSFMALLVIPQLKLSDLGLFDGSTFSFTKVSV